MRRGGGSSRPPAWRSTGCDDGDRRRGSQSRPCPSTSSAIDEIVAEVLAARAVRSRPARCSPAGTSSSRSARLVGQDLTELARACHVLLWDSEIVPLVGVAGAREQVYAPASVIAVEAAIAATIQRAAASTTAAPCRYGG